MDQSAGYQENLTFSKVELGMKTEIEHRRNRNNPQNTSEETNSLVAEVIADNPRRLLLDGADQWAENAEEAIAEDSDTREPYVSSYENENNQVCFRCDQKDHFVRFFPQKNYQNGRERVENPLWLRGSSRDRGFSYPRGNGICIRIGRSKPIMQQI